MKLERIQIFADFTGTLTIEKLQAFDATVTVDEINGKQGRGPLRPIDLPVEIDEAKRGRIGEAIAILNEVFGGSDTGQARVAAAKSAHQAREAEKQAAAEAKAAADAAYKKSHPFALPKIKPTEPTTPAR